MYLLILPVLLRPRVKHGDKIVHFKKEIGNETKALYLDELSPDRGDFPTEIMPECGLFCELEFMN